MGYERVGELAKGGAVVSKHGTRVDGYSHLAPRAKKLVIQVCKIGDNREQGVGLKQALYDV
jgi:hypothetical protein